MIYLWVVSIGLATAVVDKWTPADFPWDQIAVGPADSWKGLYMNMSDPSVNISSHVLETGVTRVSHDTSAVLFIPFSIGLAWNAFNLVLTGAGLASTIAGCQQNMGSATNIFFCVTGLISTVVGIGGAASAAKKFSDSRGWFGVAANAWDNSGLELISLNTFSRRDFIDSANETAQKAHNFFVYDALKGVSTSEPRFLGYAHDSHRLAKRDSTIHPYAPVFRIALDKYGHVDLVSRDFGAEGMQFTIAYADHPTHLKRDEYFEHERLDSNLLEARFSEEASQADPASISFDAAGAFNQIESELECFTGGNWQDGSVLSAQLYDNANQATFGFVDIGIFSDDSVDSSFANFEAGGQPLQGGLNCNS